MTLASFRTLFAAIFVISVACSASSARNKPTPSPAGDDSAAVKQLVPAYVKAFNSHNIDALGQLFTEDADFTNVQGGTTGSRKELQDHLAPLFTTRLKTVRTQASVRKVRFLTPEIAVVTSDFEFTGFKAPDGSDLPARKGFYDWIATRQNGRWMIAVFHESYIPDAPAPPPAH
jgi:uncharacterized protein (TIGR02246 family)